MSRIERISEHTWAKTLDDGRVFTLSSNRDEGMDSVLWRFQSRNWEYMPYSVAGARVIPYGFDNLLPTHLRDVLDANNLAPGILERQAGLLFGQGLHLCRVMYENGSIVRRWEDNPAITAWLEGWDYVSFVKGCLTDYLHLKGFFNSVRLEKGGRLGRTKRIARLDHIPAKNARLEWTESRNIADVRHIIEGDFEYACQNTGAVAYPVYDRNDPGRHAVSAAYHRTAAFARDFYPVPSYWGALKWIVRGSEIPTIFKYVTDNGINLAYHIQAPQEYWDQKRETLRAIHADWTDEEVENEISVLTGSMLDSLTEVLSGKENAGKFFYTVDVPSSSGSGRATWSVSAVDQKIKDFVESQLKISEASTSAITSGMGLHPSLSNIMVNGKLASGSEMLYAFKLFLLSDTEMASEMVLRPVNEAIKFNFPGSNLKLAFYHQQLEAEEALTSSARTKNATV